MENLRGKVAVVTGAAHGLGRLHAIELARELSDEQRWIQEALERDDPDGRRVVLDVPYIRQDHLSWGPASLAMVLAFFGHRVDQRDVADEITYDGTPDHAQRDWCRRHGLKVRHFQFEEVAARGTAKSTLSRAVCSFRNLPVHGVRARATSHRAQATGHHFYISFHNESLLLCIVFLL